LKISRVWLKITVVALNQVFEYHLLTFLEGIDAVNFIEALNGSKQFLLIAKTIDHHFIEIIKIFDDHQRIISSHIPVDFVDDFNSLMTHEETQLYGIEHHQYVDDDGEINDVTKEFCCLYAQFRYL